MSSGVNAWIGADRCRRSGARRLGFALRLALLAAFVAQGLLPAGLQVVNEIDCTTDGRNVSLPRGDQTANHEDHPWQVAVLRDDAAYIGGGILLGPKWVLTTGHIAEGANAAATPLAVGHPMHGEVNPRDFGRHAVAEVFVHPGYEEGGGHPNNDIALLRLADPFQVARTSYAILPLLKGEADRLERSGTCAAVTRWEMESTDPSAPLSSLRVTNVPILSQKQCRDAYGKGEISAGEICAGEVAVTRVGSSGGALTVGGLPNRPRWLVGLVSWGEVGGNPDAKPDVYVRVSEYLDWIQLTMRGPTR